MRLVPWLVYIPLQILLLPLGIPGVLAQAYKQVFVSKRLGVSQTGIEVLGGRWTMHIFGARRDHATARLAAALPNMSVYGMWLAMLPLWLVSKLTRTTFLYPRVAPEGDETIAELITARTLYFDRILERVVPDTEQFVLLGAGYDTRAYGELRRDGLRFFELDQSATQALKRDSLTKAGIDADHVTFVTVDFSREDAFEKLEGAGWDPAKKTVFLWEGVTLYLSESDVRRTLRDVREHSAPGSALVADLYAERMVAFAMRAYNRKVLEYTDEGLTFGLPFATDWDQVLTGFVESEGVRRGETHFLGTKNKKGPFSVVVELTV